MNDKDYERLQERIRQRIQTHHRKPTMMGEILKKLTPDEFSQIAYEFYGAGLADETVFNHCKEHNTMHTCSGGHKYCYACHFHNCPEC